MSLPDRDTQRPIGPYDFGYDLDQGSPLDPTMPTYATVADYITILEKNEGVEQSELDTIYPDPMLKERIILDALITATAYINAWLAGCGVSPVPVPGCQPILREICVRLARRLREVYAIRENVAADYDLFVQQSLEDICAGKLRLPGTTLPPGALVDKGTAPPTIVGGRRCGYVPGFMGGGWQRY